MISRVAGGEDSENVRRDSVVTTIWVTTAAAAAGRFVGYCHRSWFAGTLAQCLMQSFAGGKARLFRPTLAMEGRSRFRMGWLGGSI